jgi:hypothetical protein
MPSLTDTLNAIAIPRKTGSDNHTTVRNTLEHRLADAGWTTQTQTFPVSDRIYRLTQNVLFGLAAILFVAVVSMIYFAWATPFFSICAITLVVNARRGMRNQILGHRERMKDANDIGGTNLWAESGDDPERPWLIFSAHYDSKSQKMPMNVRIFTSIITGLGVVGLIVLGFLAPILFQQGVSREWMLGLTGAYLLVDGGLFWLSTLKVDDQSPGGFDNGGSVAALLTLGESLQGKVPESLGRITILFPDAEEWGLLGSAAWVNKRESELRTWKGPVQVVNCDGLGGSGKPMCVGKGLTRNPELLQRLTAAAHSESFPIRVRSTLPGFIADHLPFEWIGIRSVTLCSTGPQVRGVHTKWDTADRVDIEALEKSEAFLRAVANA